MTRKAEFLGRANGHVVYCLDDIGMLLAGKLALSQRAGSDCTGVERDWRGKRQMGVDSSTEAKNGQRDCKSEHLEKNDCGVFKLCKTCCASLARCGRKGVLIDVDSRE